MFYSLHSVSNQMSGRALAELCFMVVFTLYICSPVNSVDLQHCTVYSQCVQCTPNLMNRLKLTHRNIDILELEVNNQDKTSLPDI